MSGQGLGPLAVNRPERALELGLSAQRQAAYAAGFHAGLNRAAREGVVMLAGTLTAANLVRVDIPRGLVTGAAAQVLAAQLCRHDTPEHVRLFLGEHGADGP